MDSPPVHLVTCILEQRRLLGSDTNGGIVPVIRTVKGESSSGVKTTTKEDDDSSMEREQIR
jgi:hypothetical protein